MKTEDFQDGIMSSCCPLSPDAMAAYDLSTEVSNDIFSASEAIKGDEFGQLSPHSDTPSYIRKYTHVYVHIKQQKAESFSLFKACWWVSVCHCWF